MWMPPFIDKLILGWYPGRRCHLEELDLPNQFELSPEIERVLRGYGRLKSRSFRGVRFEINPANCLVDADDETAIGEACAVRQIAFYPLARLDDECDTCVMIDTEGAIYLFVASEEVSERNPWKIADRFEGSLSQLFTNS